MKLNLILGKTILSATMYDNESAKEFASLLPMTMKLTDFNRDHKSACLSKRLTAKEAADGIEISAGDINYYTPFRNLSIFYQDSGRSFCQVSLGKIDAGGIETIRQLSGNDPVEITFEVA